MLTLIMQDQIWVVGSLRRAAAEPDFGPHVTCVDAASPNGTTYRMSGGRWLVTGYLKMRPSSAETSDCRACGTQFDARFGARCPACI